MELESKLKTLGELEVLRARWAEEGKKVVWTYRDDKKHGIHEIQILDTNGKAIEGTPMK